MWPKAHLRGLCPETHSAAPASGPSMHSRRCLLAMASRSRSQRLSGLQALIKKSGTLAYGGKHLETLDILPQAHWTLVFCLFFIEMLVERLRQLFFFFFLRWNFIFVAQAGLQCAISAHRNLHLLGDRGRLFQKKESIQTKLQTCSILL